MGFRGIFLRRTQGDDATSTKFKVVCDAAELCLLIEQQVTSDIDKTGVVDAKILIKNGMNSELLSVTRMVDVSLEGGAVFWVVGTSVNCFRFASDTTYSEVQRAIQSLQKSEQLALMRNTLSMHPLNDTTKNKKTWKHYSECAKLDKSGKEEPLLVRPQTKRIQNSNKKTIPQQTNSTPPAKKRREITSQPGKVGNLTEIERINDARAFNEKWMTIVDPKERSGGPACHLCGKRQGRIFTCPNEINGHVFCGRCLYHRFKINSKDMFEHVRYTCRICTHECICSTCVNDTPSNPSSKAIPPIVSMPTTTTGCLICGGIDSITLQPHPNIKIEGVLICTTCIVPLQFKVASKVCCSACGLSHEISKCDHCSHGCCHTCAKKLTNSTCYFCPPQAASSTDSIDHQDGLTYFASYVQFLIERETMKKPPRISEDSCFCCKDGGELIECDFKPTSRGPRCPKVYHKECLGYDVPERVTWVCPRHLCIALKCTQKSKLICRFCATAYCEKHVPDNTRRLFPAPADTPTSIYITCTSCTDQIQLAEERGLLLKNEADTPLSTTSP